MVGTPCEEKIKFASMVTVLDEILRRFEQPRSTVRRVYKCPYCLYWHLTSSRRRFNPPAPYPLPDYYWAVLVAGKKVWQSLDEREARKVARHRGGMVVVASEKRK